MRYISVCSGIEAASVAWEPLGWKPTAFSEIEKFPCRVLKHRFPDVPNRGDMTKFEEWPDEPVDLLVAGTPCQSFSVAGRRQGMDDPRGQLAFAYAGILAKYRPRWLVWENVPGVLSSNKGRDFAAFVRELVKLGYGVCWRMLDAQHFGVPQRRKRIFAVGYLGDWRPSAAVLFERQSRPGDFAPGGKTGERIAGTAEEFIDKHKKFELVEAFQPAEVRRTGTANPRPISPTITSGMGGGDTVPRVLAFPCRMSATQQATTENLSPALQSINPTAVAIGTDCYNGQITGNISMTLKAGQGNPAVNQPTVMQSTQVRRLTPKECERLQGFPDDWTNIPTKGKDCPDGPRYKALGNSMAVPVMAWIGRRLAMVANILEGNGNAG